MQDPSSLAPERALVFELAGGSLKDFARQAQQIGLDFLLEDESAIEPSDDFKVMKGKPGQEIVLGDKQVPIHFYLAMPDETALSALVALWRKYKNNEPFEYGYAPWRELFERLYDIRPWGPQDRVLTEDLEFFAAKVSEEPDSALFCEIEFWFSDQPEVRQQRASRVLQLVTEAGGVVISEVAIEPIRYHAALVSLPGRIVEKLSRMDGDVSLLKADEVMFVRPQSTVVFGDTLVEDQSEVEDVEHDGPSDEPPLVAVLDGFPLQNHQLLVGRLDIDDPEDLESRYASNDSRIHGTSISSLIIHGDTNRRSTPIRRKLHVRPVMCCDSGSSVEHFPQDTLLVDAFYRAVRRLFLGEGEVKATAPSVRVINLSLGDGSRPFARKMTPWGRLLDYLSFEHKVLFVVSAGNSQERFFLRGFNGISDLEQANRDDLEVAVIVALNEQKATRTILSPGESVNALTVGAMHEDSLTGQGIPAMQIDPLISHGLPSVVSRVGLGYRGAVKPEVLVSGGRSLIRIVESGEGVWVSPSGVPGRVSGIGSAIPDANGRLNQTANSSSTSTAAALASRQAHRLMEALIESGRSETDDPFLPLYAKALLVHNCRVSKPLYRRLETILDNAQSTDAKKRDIARFIGFGALDYDLEPECESFRATLVGHGVLRADQGHLYRIPSPEALSGIRGWRSVSVTVAWFSPVNPRHQMYRMAKIDVSLPNTLGATSDRIPQVDYHARGKGTVYHTKIEGNSLANIPVGHEFTFQVDCRGQAGALDDDIPYAVAVSVEVGAELGIDVYTEVANRLAVQVMGA